MSGDYPKIVYNMNNDDDYKYLTGTLYEPKPQTETLPSGTKLDGDKPKIFTQAVGVFPEAIAGVSAVNHWGQTVKGYAPTGWRDVPNGVDRYTDALVRHLIAERQGQVVDPDSGLPHSWHIAWNALARAELIERSKQ